MFNHLLDVQKHCVVTFKIKFNCKTHLMMYYVIPYFLFHSSSINFIYFFKTMKHLNENINRKVSFCYVDDDDNGFVYSVL